MKILNQVFRYCLISMIVTIFLNIILSDNISAKNESDQNKSIESINSDSLSASDINSSTSRSIQNIIANKNGVVKVSPNNQVSGFTSREQYNSPELNIRGGRPSSHSIFLNGSNISNSFSGRLSSYISPHLIDNMVIRKGNISAQYGNTLGSVIDITSLRGSSKYSGFFEGISDNSIGSGFDQNFYTATLSGPLPISKNATFFALAERRYLGDRNPSYITEQSLPNGETKLPNNWQSGWSYHFNSNIPLNSKFELNAFADISNEEWSEYLHSYYFNIEHTPYYKDENKLFGGKLNYKYDEKTSFSVGYSKFESYRFSGDGKYREDIYAYGRPAGNVSFDPTGLFHSYDNPSTVSIIDTMTVDGVVRTYSIWGDESHVYDDYFKQKSTYSSLQVKIEKELSETRSLTAGVQIKNHTVRMYHHYAPTRTYLGEAANGFINVNRYGYDIFGNETDPTNFENKTKKPKEIAFFAETKLKLDDLIISAGVRYETFNLNSLSIRNLDLPLDPDSLLYDGDGSNNQNTFSLEENDLRSSESHNYFSPRLSVAFSANENTIINFDYGYFKKLPDFSKLFVGYDYLEYQLFGLGQYTPSGNSNLLPALSTTYKIGFTNLFRNNHNSITINAFYHKYENQSNIENIPSSPASYISYRNNIHSSSRGFEAFLSITPSNKINFEFNYSFTESKVTKSNTNGNVAWVSGSAPSVAYYSDHDQRHNFTGTIDYSPRPKSLFTLFINYSSGLPYTPTEIINEAFEGALSPSLLDSTNSSRMPSTINFDLRAEQGFSIGRTKLTAILWVKNLFDRENITNVWGGTGLPNSTGYAETADGQLFIDGFSTPDRTGLTGALKYDMAQQHPLNYAPPRQVYLGLRVGF